VNVPDVAKFVLPPASMSPQTRLGPCQQDRIEGLQIDTHGRYAYPRRTYEPGTLLFVLVDES
jgi:hypothetical protein